MGYSQNADSLLSALYFNNGAKVLDSNGFKFDSTFSSTPTYWAVDSFSENVVFNKITLYREDSNGNRFLTYEQEPILDELWTLDTSAGYGIESPNYNVWILSITNEILD